MKHNYLKNMRQRILVLTVLLGTILSYGQDIKYTFANAQNTNEGSKDYYEVDILIESTVDFKLGSGQLYFNYNTAAFGENISANSKLEYTQPAGYILGEVYGFPAYKDFIQNDNTESRVSISYQQGVSSGTITANNVTATPKNLFHLKIEYSDVSKDPMITFETGDSYLDQTFTACGPAASGFPDCTNHPGTQLENDTFDSSGSIIVGDDDGDGVNNDNDTCPNTPSGETVDSNGCSDSQLDDDNDGVMNNNDTCPDTPGGETVDSNGCSDSQLDDDNDGVMNNNDNCPDTPGGETVDSNGCSDSQLDDDNDGVMNDNDSCPDTPGGETVDSNGCSDSQLDDDNDGVMNNNDTCPDTPGGETVDSNGCSDSQLDDDNDGVMNDNDSCPDTPGGETVDSNGCSDSQLDDDNDGVMNNNDTCPDTPGGETVNSNGCSDSQLDDDNDGVMNNNDTCPDTPGGETVDEDGCSDNQLGVDDEILDKSIKFYPNPVTNILSIKSETIPINKIEIYSVLGKKIIEINSEFSSISTDNLSKGIYIIRIHSEKGTTVRKLIKQ